MSRAAARGVGACPPAPIRAATPTPALRRLPAMLRIASAFRRLRPSRKREGSLPETIVRLAARGDGVTESGRFFPLTAPGDQVADDGPITPGPHRTVPPCRHFPECGGCQLQHVDD